MVVIGSLITGGFALFLALHHPGELGQSLAAVCVIGQAIATVVSAPVAWWAGRPLARLQSGLDAGVAPTALPSADILVALQLPGRVFWVVWLVNLAFAVVFAVVASRVDILAHTVFDFGVGAASIGFISASAQSYVMAGLVRNEVSPLLLAGGRLDHLAGPDGTVPHTFVFQHLTRLVAVLAIAWPAALYTLLREPGEPGVGKWVVLGTMIAVLVMHHLFSILRAISWSVGHLAGRMEAVRAGDLSVQAIVFGLDTFGVLASDFNRMVEGLRQREQLKESFGRYVTQQVVDEILAGRVALGGELKTATVLFSDIRGFTHMSEKLQPQEVVAFLNEYLEAMVDCVIEHGGVLDKFIGDAVMAVFGAPVSAGDPKDDAAAAVACAVAMGQRLSTINTARVARGQAEIKIGIGVHTGELVAGNIGSPRRMQYTVIGDTVNVGSRLESLTKEHHRRTLLSEATAQLVKERFGLVEVGRVPVRGRDEPLTIFGLTSEG